MAKTDDRALGAAWLRGHVEKFVATKPGNARVVIDADVCAPNYLVAILLERGRKTYGYSFEASNHFCVKRRHRASLVEHLETIKWP